MFTIRNPSDNRAVKWLNLKGEATVRSRDRKVNVVTESL